MKHVLILLFLISSSIRAQTTNFKGRVFDRLENVGLQAATVSIAGTEQSTTTNPFGEFEFKDLPEGIYNFIISFPAYGDTLASDVLVKDGVGGNLYVTLPGFCEYDKKKGDKTCPKCGKKDEAIPIAYGEEPPKKEEKVFYGGCKTTYCAPNWYCKRDNLQF